MEDKIGNLICERNDDLVAFLYQELDEREGRAFEQHLGNCASCSQELNSFSEIRKGVIAWREQSLGIIRHRPSLAFGFAEKPSALVAIRQFFALSPLWLKGSVAFASVLLFAAVAFMVVSFKVKPVAPLASTDKVYSEADLRAKVEEGVQARLKELNPQHDAVKKDSTRPPLLVQQSTPKARSSGSYVKTRRAPLTDSERQQLAADLRLISSTEDDLNLLGEQINR
ncbi:MAG: zf-HC2 domain-containing protein [Acidobacteriota bacterium]|nr:zf-HC2 domain-containing protein [Acidobacteriota bacterium]